VNYDYIVVGAGAAGCIVASRLTEDAASRVLLIEAGGSERTPIVDMPAAVPFAYGSKRLGWGYQAGPEPNLNGRFIDEKRGRVIGGSASINAMIYNRGNPLDFEGWAENGLKDWDYACCLPYFRKMETFSSGPDDWRGGDGPLRISRCKADHPLHDYFLRAGEQAGHSVTEDHNGYRQEGLHVAQAFIHEGYRWSSARAYLRPAASRSNLEIWSNALVHRVIIENGAATGIEVNWKGQLRTVRCNREVILCAGALNTPQLLMLSGVGDADKLRSLGIDVNAHVPEIGQNLENHPGVNIQYATDHEHSLVSQLGPLGRIRLGAEWLLFKKGLGTTNFFETGAFLKTRDDVTYPNAQFEFLPLVRLVKNGKLVAVPGFQFWVDLSRPESRGSVSLRSANPTDAPHIVFNHLQAKQDLQDMIDAVRVAREIIAQPVWNKVRKEEITPGASATSDADIARFIRENLGTSYHPSGTCRMGVDDRAVVDSDGNLKAVKNIRIVDASIMPRIVTANLAASIMMMAEKLSDRIRGKQMLPPSTAKFYRSDVSVAA
jgi:choline dehydrogenase